MSDRQPKSGEASPVTLPGTELRSVHSDALDRGLELFVKLPLSYERSELRYPVLYCLDANRSFPLYATMSLILETPGLSSQEIVLVGVGYQVDSDRLRGLAQWAAWRTRDLTPVRDEETERFWTQRLSAITGDAFPVGSGGAPQFLAALRDDVIPFVEANYRVLDTGRGLAGYSYGGLFVLYTLLRFPGLFERFFAGSPTMRDQLFEYEQRYAAASDDLKASVFTSAGSLEMDLRERLERFVARLRSRDYPQLELETTIFARETHESAYSAAVSRALRVLYYPDTLVG
jgi:predicted alpha/beta superfamily hydrolase